MFSPSKHIDRLLLYEIGQMIQTLLRHVSKEGVLETIEGYAKSYEELEKRIHTYDYTRADELLEMIHDKNK